MNDDQLEPLIRDAVLRARITKLVETPRVPAGWERFLESRLVQLVGGFLFTVVLGGGLTTLYQSLAAKSQRSAELRVVRKEQALAVVDTVGLLLTRGYYAYARYYDALGAPTETSTLRDRRDRFNGFNDEFESRWFLDAARVQHYFGASRCEQFMRVARAFHFTNPVLRKSDPAFERGAVVRPDTSTVYDLRNSVFDFVLALVNDLPRALDSLPSPARAQDCRRPFGTNGAGYDSALGR